MTNLVDTADPVGANEDVLRLRELAGSISTNAGGMLPSMRLTSAHLIYLWLAGYTLFMVALRHAPAPIEIVSQVAKLVGG